MPLLSIIIPVYNSENYISKTIESVLKQSMKDFELILVDDGSTDGTEKIINKQFKDSRIKYFKKLNGGPSSARNYGLNQAIGKYIVFIDSDDSLFDINSLAGYVTNTEPNYLYVCNYQIKSKKKLYNHNVEINSFILKQNSLDILMKKGLLNTLYNKTFERSIIQQNNIRFDQEVKMGEDLIFILEYLKNVQGVIIDSTVRYIYVDDVKGSLSKKYYSNLYEMFTRIYDAFESLIDTNSDLKRSDIYYNHLFKSLFNMVLMAIVIQSNKGFLDKRNRLISIVQSKPAKIVIRNANNDGFTKFVSVCLSLLKLRMISFFICLIFLAKVKSKNIKRVKEQN